MAKGKRDKRETIRSMAVDPDLFDTAVWQPTDDSPGADTGGETEAASLADAETS